jgi:hypothetical protein
LHASQAGATPESEVGTGQNEVKLCEWMKIWMPVFESIISMTSMPGSRQSAFKWLMGTPKW